MEITDIYYVEYIKYVDEILQAQKSFNTEIEEKNGKKIEFIIQYFNGDMRKTSKGFIKGVFEEQ